MTAVRLTWTDPTGRPAEAEVDTLQEAQTEQRRLHRGGCSDVRILTDLTALPPVRSGQRNPDGWLTR